MSLSLFRLPALLSAAGLCASLYVGCVASEDGAYDVVMTKQAMGDGHYGGYGYWGGAGDWSDDAWPTDDSW